MATRRRIGVSAASTEAARRQLMQPVNCWEKAWHTPDNAPPNSTLKVYRWVKSERLQQFSDDEGETDEPLAPLPDEPEVVEGDEEEQEEGAENGDTAEATTQPAVVVIQEEPASKAPSPKPQLTMSIEPVVEPEELDASLNPLDTEMVGGDEDDKLGDKGDLVGLDMELATEGLPLDGVDGLMESIMDETLEPFVES